MGKKACLAKRVRGRPLAWAGLCHVPVGGGSSDPPNTAATSVQICLTFSEAKMEGFEATTSSKLVAFLLSIPFLSLFVQVGMKG